MKAKPILFNGDMANALLDGRKTQTRRIVDWKKLHKEAGLPFPTKCRLAWFNLIKNWGIDVGDSVMREVNCPHGKPGDLLWVREAYRCNGWATDVATIFYKASARNSYTEMCEQVPIEGKSPLAVTTKWTPSIHMPRWASRLTLRIVSVRLERLDNIGEQDAIAEGVEPNCAMIDHSNCDHETFLRYPFDADSEPAYTAIESFESLWESINGDDSWKANPWVWVIEFEVIKKNVDEVMGEE